MTEARLYIDGRWCDGADGRWAPVRNPATGTTIGRVALATDADVDRAVAAARRSAIAWRELGPETRGEMLRRAATILALGIERAAAALTAEQGKTLAESRAEIARAIETLVWHADAAPAACRPREMHGGSTVVRPEPIGVVAAFTPWNYPAVIMARKLGAAFAAGCTVVLKAAEETPTIAGMLVASLEEAGVPSGVMNLVFGDPPAVAARLIDSPSIRAVSFTGSTAVGRQLAARCGAALERMVLELGGHAPVLVLADADVAEAARAIAAYKWECAGQSCNAPSRVYVHASRQADFLGELVASAARIRVGDGSDPSADMGPLATERRLAATERLMADARARGARVHIGGARVDRPGWFFPPTVLTDVAAGAALLEEEPFCPILPVWPFTEPDDAIARANETPYGLAAYVFTRDAAAAASIAAALEAGSVGVNQLRGVPPDVGIAGVKHSGFGYEGGFSGIEAFMNLKVVRGVARPIAIGSADAPGGDSRAATGMER